MKIIVKPSDLVKRCIWDKYTYYVVGSEKDAEELLRADIEFEMSEKDAIVIELLKCMETDNLIHKFNEHMVHMLSVKSTKNDNSLYIRKKTVETTIEKFAAKFPTYWDMPLNYKRGYEDLLGYIEKMDIDIQKLEIHEMTFQNCIYETYSSSAVKKILNFVHY
jgi:hypothetical protein